jgi:ribosomal protein S18 acetylase RimI-like enzyme
MVLLKNNKNILLRRLNSNDFDKLSEYLQNLSTETKKRFGPHLFDRETIINLYTNSNSANSYIAIDQEAQNIIAYSIIKIGYLEHDNVRLRSYGLVPDNNTDCTFAPSVADAWQGRGIGNALLNFILDDLITFKIKRIILWGGVQTKNYKAVNFYIKNGFKILGKFEYIGENYDMIKEIGN